jgi:two-component system NarL family sensor kinase
VTCSISPPITAPDRFLVAYAVVGALLASRRPVNPIGWLLLGIGLVSAARGLAGEYALHTLAGQARPASGVWAVWFVNWVLALLFPSGILMFLPVVSASPS